MDVWADFVDGVNPWIKLSSFMSHSRYDVFEQGKVTMARAVCTQCSSEFSWHGGRGMRLADILSPCCSAPAKGKVGTRRKDRRTIMAYIQQKRTKAWLLDDGCVATHLTYHRGKPLKDVKDGWRMFTCGGCRESLDWCSANHAFLMQEKDWQRLIAQGIKTTL